MSGIKPNHCDTYRCPFKNPISVRLRPENVSRRFDSLQDSAIGSTSNGVSRQQARSLCPTRFDLRPCSLEPVADQISFVRHSGVIKVKQGVHVGVAQLAAQPLAPQKRWIANNHVRRRPHRFHGLPGRAVGQDGIHAAHSLNRLEDRFGRRAKAVAAQPLDIADPDRGLRQFVRIRVDLDAVELPRRRRNALQRRYRRQPQRQHPVVHRFPQVEQREQRQVEEVAAAGRRVEHADARQLGCKVHQQVLQLRCRPARFGPLA